MTGDTKLRESLGSVRIGLRREVIFTRQSLRGRPSYVAHDPLTFQNYSFTKREYRILTAIVQERSLSDSFNYLVERGVMQEREEDNYYHFILSLHWMNLLQLPIIDPGKLYGRFQKKQAAKRFQWLTALLYFKVPLVDPDQLLARSMRWVSLIFSRYGMCLWVMLLAFAGWKCWGRFDEMFAESGNLLRLVNIPILWLLLVFLKVFHEFGHAYTCKSLGGEVPEMGVCFIACTPCAYVDASASWKLSGKWQRMAVALGGMYIEIATAAIAALVWAGTPPGFLHDLALNVVVLASVVTLLFNLNPLMRFDGYFIFSDLVGVANLRDVSLRHLRTWSKRLFLGLTGDKENLTPSDRLLFFGYGCGAFIYKGFLAVVITKMVIMRWPVLGMVMGVAFGWMMLVKPFSTLLNYLFKSKETAAVRLRASLMGSLVLALPPVLFFYLPVSFSVMATGILEPEEKEILRAPVDGFVTASLVKTNDWVRRDQELITMSSQELVLERDQIRAQIKAEKLRFEAEEITDRVKAAGIAASLDFLGAQARDLDDRVGRMRVASSLGGHVATAKPAQVVGRFVRQGDPLLEVHGDDFWVHLILAEEDASRAHLIPGVKVGLRWHNEPGDLVTAEVVEVRPVASRGDIPLPLTMLAGGDVYAQSSPAGGVEAFVPYVHVFLKPQKLPPVVAAGLLAKVRVFTEAQTLGDLIYRKVLSFYHSWLMS